MSVFSSFHRAFVSVEFFPRASTSVYVFMWTRREIDKSRELYRKKNGKKCSSCEWMRVCVYTLCGCLFGCKVSSFDVASLSFPSQMQWEAILFFFFLFHIFINNPGFVCCISVCVCVRWTKKNATLDRPSFPQNLGEISNNDIDYLRIALSIGAESWKLDDSSSLHSTDFCQLDVYINGTSSICGWWLRYIDGIRDSRWRPAVLTQGQL